MRLAEISRIPVRNRGSRAGEYTRNTRGIQDEHGEITNPCKFDDLPKCWDVNHFLIRRNTVMHFDIYIVVILGAIIDALSEWVLQSLVSLGLVVIDELLHVDCL